MENKNFANWVRYSVAFRAGVVGILALLLLLPVSMVRNLINQRESTKKTAEAEISQKWGGQQTIAGPVLSVPYKRYAVNTAGERVATTRYAHFLPEKLSINAEVKPQVRSRGIFDAVVYSSEINFSGKFARPNIKNLGIKEEEADWSKAFVSVGISDTRGIEENIKIGWNGSAIGFEPGIPVDDVIRDKARNYDMEPYYGKREQIRLRAIPPPIENTGKSSGISARLPLNKGAGEYQFSFKLNLAGSRDIQFVPVGRTTEIFLKSDWNTPSFSGAFLPDRRTVTENGFDAFWKILDLNRGYPQAWLGNAYNIYPTASGVKLLITVDDYKKTQRSAKYALLIISLTFLVFFFSEVFSKKRIHPIQYILVGLAIVLFYVLLVSISEVAGFGWAYLTSSAATIGLITLYSRSILVNGKTALMQGAILAFLYLFIYIILQLEDYALLMGSLLLFSILATVMYLSRKIDWYAVEEGMRNN